MRMQNKLACLCLGKAHHGTREEAERESARVNGNLPPGHPFVTHVFLCHLHSLYVVGKVRRRVKPIGRRAS